MQLRLEKNPVSSARDSRCRDQYGVETSPGPGKKNRQKRRKVLAAKLVKLEPFADLATGPRVRPQTGVEVCLPKSVREVKKIFDPPLKISGS